jgi:hypothetical protein
MDPAPAGAQVDADRTARGEAIACVEGRSLHLELANHVGGWHLRHVAAGPARVGRAIHFELVRRAVAAVDGQRRRVLVLVRATRAFRQIGDARRQDGQRHRVAVL